MAKINGFYNDYKGLNKNEVDERLDKYGRNEINPEKKEGLISKIIDVFKEPMFILLIVTSILYFILGEPRDATIMLIFVIFVSSIEFIQEYKTDKTLKALRELSSPRVTVCRNSEMDTIDSATLVPDDLMILEEGEKIPADGIIIEMFDLGVDESSLTGESEVVMKSIEDVSNEQFKKNMVYQGTLVTGGTAIVRVTATGVKTEYGKIGLDVAQAPEEKTPLEKQIRVLIFWCAFASLIMLTLVFIANILRTHDIVDSILAGLTLAMGIIPEEFPVILTVFLSMGAFRLAKKHSIIRKLPSVQTLGTISVLCVDKTGTITKNHMEVKDTYFEVKQEEYLKACVLASEISPFDPMEKAIIEYADSQKVQREELYNSGKLVYEYAFSSQTKNMAHVWEIDGKQIMYAKGSPESILKLCNLEENKRNEIEEKQIAMAKSGLRVIAIAKTLITNDFKESLSEYELEFIGLIGFCDPPRESVLEAVEKCHKAGIKIVMITGDNAITAKSIGEQVGLIDNGGRVITGDELDAMTMEELIACVDEVSIFARVAPRHKMQIVKALKETGKIVGMTGDGVNDAPALKYADIGISMGKRGTSVAREASDMVLLDDNFTTIVDTIEDGRKIYDNIRKAIGYVLIIHIPIALIALFSPMLGMPLMLLPIHIVLLELIIDPTCSIVFERQPAEKNILSRKPRNPKENIVNKKVLFKSIIQGLVIFMSTFGSYMYLINTVGEITARSFALTVLVLCNIFLIYVNMSERSYAFQGILKSAKDKVLFFTNLLIVSGLLLILYTPVFNNIVKTVPLSLKYLLSALGVAIVSTMWWEIVKLIKNLFLKEI